MANFPVGSKPGVRARERNALERIADLELKFNNLIESLQQSFNNQDRNIQELVDVTSATVRTVGAEKVADSLKAIQTEKAEAEAKRLKEQLDNQLLEGTAVPGTVITEKSVITGVERDAEGKDVVPGYVQLPLGVVKPEFQTKLLGLKAGDVIDTENGHKFEVTGVYELVEKPAEEKKADAPVAEEKAAE